AAFRCEPPTSMASVRAAALVLSGGAVLGSGAELVTLDFGMRSPLKRRERGKESAASQLSQKPGRQEPDQPAGAGCVVVHFHQRCATLLERHAVPGAAEELAQQPRDVGLVRDQRDEAIWRPA